MMCQFCPEESVRFGINESDPEAVVAVKAAAVGVKGIVILEQIGAAT